MSENDKAQPPVSAAPGRAARCNAKREAWNSYDESAFCDLPAGHVGNHMQTDRWHESWPAQPTPAESPPAPPLAAPEKPDYATALEQHSDWLAKQGWLGARQSTPNQAVLMLKAAAHLRALTRRAEAAEGALREARHDVERYNLGG